MVADATFATANIGQCFFNDLAVGMCTHVDRGFISLEAVRNQLLHCVS